MLIIVLQTIGFIGFLTISSTTKDPGLANIPHLVSQASGMNLTEEERSELEYCVNSSKVFYLSQAIEKCLTRAKYKN